MNRLDNMRVILCRLNMTKVRLKGDAMRVSNFRPGAWKMRKRIERAG